jgi:hypothetical protein
MDKKSKKPTPKSQYNISRDSITPFDESVGNPNPSSQKIPRGQQTSVKGDKFKQLSIGLKDIDTSIVYYFTNVIKPTVIQNSNRIEVPIIYGSPERWKSFQKDGVYRDKKGKIMAPIIMFKRNQIQKDRTQGNKLDANNPINFGIFEKKYSQKNAYDNFAILTNKIPIKEYYATVIPDYVTITYSCIVQTYYIEQLNKLIEDINYTSDSYWGDPELFKFRAKIDSFTTTNEIGEGENRIVRGTFDIVLRGYIIPDNIQKQINTFPKFYSKSAIRLGIETTTDDLADPDFLTFIRSKPSKSTPSFIDSPSISSGVSQASIDYINSNSQIQGNVIDNITVEFPKGFLLAPTGLPSTSLNDFKFFVNGALIEPAAIVGFTDNQTSSTLVIDENVLGYGFDSQDVVIAIGKFKN